MAYKKREEAAIIGQMKTRLSAMEQIDADQKSELDYGGPAGALTSKTVNEKLTTYDNKLSGYNKLLEQADRAKNELKTLEKDISADYANVLSSAQSKFKQNSHEVEMLGGTRSEERKRPVRTPKK